MLLKEPIEVSYDCVISSQSTLNCISEDDQLSVQCTANRGKESLCYFLNKKIVQFPAFLDMVGDIEQIR